MKSLVTYLSVLFSLLFAFNAKAQTINIADPRLDFEVQGLNGEAIKLSSLKGKVFLLDFWASWCGPCRMANKGLSKVYSKYKDKGFEIFSVSLDDDTKSWKKAIKKDKITWMQAFDPGGWDAASAVKWNIIALPSSFLVDKDGNVVAFDPEKSELENKLRVLLGL